MGIDESELIYVLGKLTAWVPGLCSFRAGPFSW